MKVAVVSAVYNEEKRIGQMLESLLAQTRLPDEIVIVDDGSTDHTAWLIECCSKHFPLVRLIRHSNQGPAVSRNLGWRTASADIVVFTDGDCIPDHNWIEKLLPGFSSQEVAAVGGTYRTLNRDSRLARFVGYEIDWRYRYVRGAIDAHGSYNLAVRRAVLEEMNGFDESYKAPSGEDWDLTYRISRKYKILFEREAIVAHAHPESFWPYMKNQVRRGFDRIKLYNEHPEKRGGDIYTGGLAKYQVLVAGLLPAFLVFSFWPFFRGLAVLAAVFLFVSCLNSFLYIFQRDPGVAFYGLGVQFCRCFAWAWGAVKGVLRFGYKIRF